VIILLKVEVKQLVIKLQPKIVIIKVHKDK